MLSLRGYKGASGIGSLLANTLAVRNVTVVVLDIKPIETENCRLSLPHPRSFMSNLFADNVAFYNCDVSKWEEVEKVAKQVVEEVRRAFPSIHSSKRSVTDWTSYCHYQQRGGCSRETYFGSNTGGCQTVTYNLSLSVYASRFFIIELLTQMCSHTFGP
jgi:hypothetical protein